MFAFANLLRSVSEVVVVRNKKISRRGAYNSACFPISIEISEKM